MKLKKLLGNFIDEKGNIFQLLVIAVLISLAMVFIGTGLLNLLNLSERTNLIIGLIILVTSCSYFVFKLSRKSKGSIRINASLFYGKKTNKILDFPNYNFTKEIIENFKSAFIESDLIKKIWDSNTLSFNNNDNDKSFEDSSNLVLEVVEYDILKMLSHHLYAYFEYKPKLKKKLKTYKREDATQFLFNNSFFELFSKPQTKRAAFWDMTKSKSKKSDDKGDTTSSDNDIKEISSMTAEGHKFENFELTLPQKSKISRPKTGKIKVKSRFIEIDISIEFNGYHSTTPENFSRYYLGVDDYEDVERHDLSIELDFKLNRIAMFLNNSLGYEKWIDSFIARLDYNYSIDSYLKRINWENVNAILISTKNMNK